MDKRQLVDQDERTLAALAHGSIVLGVLTSGIGGIFASLAIWLTQREKSTYVAHQSLQALVYQISTLLLAVLGFCAWGFFLMLAILPPIAMNPELYQYEPPPSLWIGMALLALPFGLWFITILYGLWGAFRSLSGADFEYLVIGKMLKTSAPA